jgi:hypothetical protein
VIALIEDREVVKKILAHLKLPTEPLPLLPARRMDEPELPFGPVRFEPDVLRAFNEWPDEPVGVELLPAWMRESPARAGLRAHGPADFDDVDEAVNVSRLPPWMRSAPAPRRAGARRPKWRPQRTRRSASEQGFWPDEDVDVSRLPQWMRTGSFWGPAPPNWDGIDAPSPGAEAFVDPIYEEP